AATGRTLAPGARVLVAADAEAFDLRYGPGKPVAGEYSGSLDNAGERVFLATPGGDPIRDVEYSDDAPWPLEADGVGFSLVRRFPGDTAGDSDAGGWRASAAPGGSPGGEDVPAPGTYDGRRGTAVDAAGRLTAAVSGEDADPDGDGRSNFEEFAFATDPLAQDRPVLAFEWSGPGTGQHAGIRFLRPAAVSGVRYELLGSDDLGEWLPVDGSQILGIAPGEGSTESALIREPQPATGDRRFLKLRAVPEG